MRPFTASKSAKNYTGNEYSNDHTDDEERRYLRCLIPIVKFSVFLFVVATLIYDGNGDDCLLNSVIVLCRYRDAGRRTHLTSWYSQWLESVHAPAFYLDRCMGASARRKRMHSSRRSMPCKSIGPKSQHRLGKRSTRGDGKFWLQPTIPQAVDLFRNRRI
jgi:hypothetical protein